MSLDIAIPGLIWQNPGDLEYILPEINAPGLINSLKYAKISYLNSTLSDFIYNPVHNLINQQPGTLAEYFAKQLQVYNQFTHFLIAEPVHLRVDRDRLLISEAELLQLDSSEAYTIINLINQHFAPEFKLHYINEHMWLLGFNHTSNNEKFYPVIEIIGENIDDYLPQEIYYTKFLNEVQMLLFNTTINQIRKHEGSLPISSIWLWNKAFSQKLTQYDNIYTNNKNLFSSYDKILPLPSEKFKLSTTNNLVFIDNLYYPAMYRDSYNWLHKLQDLDIQILQPLELKEFNLLIPGMSNTIKINIRRTLFRRMTTHLNINQIMKEWHAKA